MKKLAEKYGMMFAGAVFAFTSAYVITGRNYAPASLTFGAALAAETKTSDDCVSKSVNGKITECSNGDNCDKKKGTCGTDKASKVCSCVIPKPSPASSGATPAPSGA